MRTPYLYDGRIIYQSGEDLYTYDIASGATSSIALRLARMTISRAAAGLMHRLPS